jgi:hypothetical protein
MLETGKLMVRSLFNRSQPVPEDSKVFPRAEALVTVKKIA